jgi:uncharacterized protein
MENPKFQIFKSNSNSRYYFRLRAKNGETILSSEGYVNKQGCIKGVTSVKTNAPLDNRYKRKDNIGNYTFNLTASNGEIIGRSENYTTRAVRENGIEAVKRISFKYTTIINQGNIWMYPCLL